jgi:hypothetical protein
MDQNIIQPAPAPGFVKGHKDSTKKRNNKIACPPHLPFGKIENPTIRG